MFYIPGPSHGGPRDSSMWSVELTELLIQVVKENFSRLTGKRERRSAVWLDIARMIKRTMMLIYIKRLAHKDIIYTR